jgi:energy-coupling factor transporter ATP-binding protein EcfA2
MTDKFALEIKDLTFRYHSREEAAIRNINIAVMPGQVVLIAGASGCGKTTLARCINGLIPRSYKGDLQGSIKIHGKDTRSLSLARISQMVGTVLQDPERQILGTKVINEVSFGLENLGWPREKIMQTAADTLIRLKIPQLRMRETFHLSGGEKQKVALAGVLAMKPSLLLLDEPLASLDPASAQEALQMIRILADEGMTVLMVEHRVEDVLKIKPDRVLFMKDGEIRYDGPASGMNRKVDYHEVKLPAPLIIKLAAKDPIPAEIIPLKKYRDRLAKGLVEFKHVCYSYDHETDVLHDINLTIRRGDVIAVLGPNGAGKTTLVKHAIGLLKPTSGEVLVEGKNTHDMSVAQIASNLGYVFQSPSHMLFAPTVDEELAFGPINIGHKPEDIPKEVHEAVEIVHLNGLEKYPPLALSFGQQKRVSIAAILAMKSRIMVMDEPTAGQDYKNYMDFMDSILQLPNFESILFITHDVDLALIHSNRIILVNDGRLVADGKPQDVLKDFNFLRQNRIIPTTLLKSNLDYLPRTGHFMRAEALAHVPLNTPYKVVRAAKALN